jgi:TonB-linked SusC/RagA family outer membrane protein
MKKNQRLKVLSLIFLFALFSSIGAYSQEQRVTVNLKNASLKKVFSVIEKQTTYRFSYRNAVVDKKNDINISERNVSVPTVLNQVLASRNLEYEIVSSKMIVISEKEIKAQPKEKAVPIISGIVKDDKGEPIIGASVLVKGTTKGTVTDINGHFELNDIPDNSTFIVSYVGYSTQQIPIQGKSSLKIQMTEDTKTVDEVVVVGYGTQKKVNLTGAVSAISNKEISDRKVVQTSLALQGIAPGVTITQRSGQPGLDAGNIRIRGIGTLNNSDPLILVDGVEMDMNTIDASSIESISILKDAASSSIYGSKAANGVILITTKRAASGKFRFSLNSYLTKQSATDLPKKVNAIDHMTLLNEAKVNSGAGTVYSDEEIEKWKKEGPSNRDLYPDTDWQNEILKGGGIQQSHTFTLQGGTDQIKVFASLNYLNQDAIIKNVNYQRLSLRMNTDFIISKTLTTTLDLYVYNQKRRSVASYNSVSSNGSGIGYVFYLMNKLPAVQAAKYSNGLYAEGQNGENPLAFINEGGFTKVVATPITATLSIKWNPIKDLNFKASISPNISYPNTKYFVNTVSTYNADGSSFFYFASKIDIANEL